ncbi:MAG TPA: hypothetical protein VNM87_13110, partial [Candidatus Udaeobacter sp.]|nr:hypothetical protein [Candidatus Udaeobacter sp.]
GQDPEVVVLDDLTNGDRIALALSPALAGRVVMATTDWEDPFALLEFLAASPWTRATACNRLRIVLGQRRLRSGQAMSRDAEPAVAERYLLDTLVVSPAFRAALRKGAMAAELQAVATQDGYRAPSVSAGEAADTSTADRTHTKRAS